jgi:hypothetical protein
MCRGVAVDRGMQRASLKSWNTSDDGGGGGGGGVFLAGVDGEKQIGL